MDARERPRDYITEDELCSMVEGTKRSRYYWRDASMLMLTFYHGLRVSELCQVQRRQVDFKHGHIWVERLKGSLSTQQPLLPHELQTLKCYLKQRGDSRLPWLFLSERGNQFARFTTNYMVRTAAARTGLGFSVHPHMLRHECGYALANRGYDLRLIQDLRRRLDILPPRSSQSLFLKSSDGDVRYLS